MSLNNIEPLWLESLSLGIPVIPAEAAGFYRHNCMICLHENNHKSGVQLLAVYRKVEEFLEICWDGEITTQLINAYRDRGKFTDFGACTIALLFIRERTEFTAVEQSVVGTTIDYYLAPQDQQDDTLIFNHSVRLEVSGILVESPDNTVDDRIRDKMRRLRSQKHDRTLIVIVEFSRPWLKMVEA